MQIRKRIIPLWGKAILWLDSTIICWPGERMYMYMRRHGQIVWTENGCLRITGPLRLPYMVIRRIHVPRMWLLDLVYRHSWSE